MENKNSVDAKEAQLKVSNAMGDITRAAKKVLVDYLYDGFVKHFAKAIAYLEVDDAEADDILRTLDFDLRTKIINYAKELNKKDGSVISEVEHIITTEGMKFENEYKAIKDNILFTGQDFAEEALANFRNETPLFQDALNHCIFDFEDIALLDNRSIQKILRDIDQQELAKALKGSDPEVQEAIFQNMSMRAASMLKEDMEFMGPIRLEDVEASRAKIIKIIFHLEELGVISIARMTVGELID